MESTQTESIRKFYSGPDAALPATPPPHHEPVANQLQDTFGRRFAYLRLSITDACNFRCVYCLPNGYKKPVGQNEFLSVDEIRNLARVFVQMGTKKIRLTGGEPTLRPDFLEIIETLRDIPGLEQIALSTNAYRLKELAPRLRELGVSSLNVSLDSLDPAKFREMTGSALLPKILDGINTALDVGFPLIKVNAVLMRGWNSDDLDSFMKWVEHKPIAVRFIELMRTGGNKTLFDERHVSADTLRADLRARGWTLRERGATDGPAQEFIHPDYVGRIGVIAPYSKDFCSTCNRLRVSSRGGLRLCLFGDGDHPLRDLLQHEDQAEELKARLHSLLKRKEVSHYLPEGKFGDNQGFSAIGG